MMGTSQPPQVMKCKIPSSFLHIQESISLGMSVTTFAFDISWTHEKGIQPITKWGIFVYRAQTVRPS